MSKNTYLVYTQVSYKDMKNLKKLRRKKWRNKFAYIYTHIGPDSSVSITTDYGLDGPGSNPGGDEIFRPLRPGPTQIPVQRVPGLSRE